MRILLVEDDYITRSLLVKFLSNYGEVDIVVDGQEAIEWYTINYQEGNKYDLICLDIMMPLISGYQVLEYIRNFEKELGAERTFIAMMTGLYQESNKKQAFDLGADDYIDKPIDMETINEFINKHPEFNKK